MENKVCKNCGIEKNTNEFVKNRRICKICFSDIRKIDRKKYYENNKDIYKTYYENNKDKILDNHRTYLKEYNVVNREKESIRKKTYRLNNKDVIKEKARIYYQNNKDKFSTYQKDRYNNNDLFRITKILRSLIGKSYRENGYKKQSKTENILGCTFKEFKIYLESKFEDWMTYSNHGLYNGSFAYGWDIDHIIPLSSAKTEEELIKLNHYTNLQPLDSKTNRDIKRNNIY